ncbi:hypothetical protein QBC43DRAFT_355640 [Cladorrhinum sp. PSN259]|nr:hypothetical protein QBC43DRAFT_355640 [Cladorrhinum sp. PSN259]
MLLTALLARFSVLILAAPSSTLASNLNSTTSTSSLQPWQITDLHTYTPSGRPGNTPYSTFSVSIVNPNNIPLPETRWGNLSFPPSTATCSTKWIDIYINEQPFDKVIPCEAAGFGEGKWTMEIQRANVSGYGPSPTRDFTLEFKMEESMVLNEGAVRLQFVGRMGFAVRENLKLTCAASGFCNTWLDEEKKPLLVAPVVQVQCLYGVCDGIFNTSSMRN